MNRAERRAVASAHRDSQSNTEWLKTAPGTDQTLQQASIAMLNAYAQPETDMRVALGLLQQEHLSVIRGLVRAALQSRELQNEMRDMVKEAAKEIAKEVLAEQTAELEAAIRTAISAAWDTSIQSAMHAELEESIRSVRRRFASPPP